MLGWFVIGFLVTFVLLNVLGVWQTLSPITGTETAEAERLAVAFVEEYYPQLATADRNVYTATIQGTDYYVVDFVARDASVGLRVLVDRLLRAVFAYEYIDGGP